MTGRPLPVARSGFNDNASPTILNNRLKVRSLLDQGGFALVYRGEFQDNNHVIPVAVKVPLPIGAPEETLRKRSAREIRINKGISHPNILRFYGIATEGSIPQLEMTKDLPGLVFELCEGGSIGKFLQAHPGTQSVPLIYQAALGLEYLHNVCNIVHGDIKPENIFIKKEGSSFKAVLADFGRSRAESLRGFTTTFALSYVYVAPELANGLQASVVTKSADIYSFGVSILTIVSGKPPFYALPGLSSMFMLTVSNERPRRQDHASPELSEGLWALICHCWQVQHQDRPAIKEVADTLWSVMSSGK